MEEWDTLVPWMSALSGEDMQGDWVSELWDGVLLCQVINGIERNKINVNTNFQSDDKAALTNLENFLQASKDLGVDESHLFPVQALEENDQPDAETMEMVRYTLGALKAIHQQRGTLEKQNVWRRDAAEVRAGQNVVRHNFHKKEVKTLSDVTGAVRAFKETTNNDADLRYQRKGQQKWKLFETNYQREKGITLEQSLQEIEEFERTGKAPASMQRKGPARGFGGASSGFRGELDHQLTNNKNSSQHTTGNRSASFGQPGRKTSHVQQQSGVPIGKRGLTVKPKPGGSKGAEFFKNFAERENRKYRPGNNNASKKLW